MGKITQTLETIKIGEHQELEILFTDNKTYAVYHHYDDKSKCVCDNITDIRTLKTVWEIAKILVGKINELTK